MGKEKSGKNSGASFKAGAVALAFMIIGYQSALFVHRAAVMHIEASRDRPDTVYVLDRAVAEELLGPSGQGLEPSGRTYPGGMDVRRNEYGNVELRRDAEHSRRVSEVRTAGRPVESFPFDPNTVSVADLIRLGFSEKQAASIDNYRAKGGRFRRPSDFAASYVVSDSVYRRLEKYISIPLIDINRADSAAFDTLPGVGGWFASRMVSYRNELGGYSYPEQLMDIRNFDREKFDGLRDLICCSPPEDSLELWSADEDRLRLHPYIRDWNTAHSVVLYRNSVPKSEWSVAGLAASGAVDENTADRLARCAISSIR